MGYLFAIITSLFFTLYVIPKKLSAQNADRYSMFQGFGYFGASLIAYIVIRLCGGVQNESLANPFLWVSALSGAVWFTGCLFFLIAIDECGLSRSNQWKNLQGPFGAIFNLVFLAEYTHTNVLYIILASISILISAMLFNVKKAEEKGFKIKGILFALGAAVCFGVNSMLQKLGTNHGLVFSQVIFHSGAVVVVSVVYLLIKEKNINCIKQFGSKDNLMGVLGGALFAVASYCGLMAYKHLPGSVAFTIIQLNAVWTVLAGVLIFKEIDFKKNWWRILIGILFAVGGVILLMI